MRSRERLIAGVMFLLSSSPAVHAQAAYAATRSVKIQAGVGGLLLHNDYNNVYDKGVTLFGDYNFHRYAGLEADIHLGGISVPDAIGEDTYLAGPRLTFPFRTFTFYGKALFGRGSIFNENSHTSTGYNVFSYGGGVDLRLGRRFTARLLDMELQKWPDFNPNTLSPIASTVGIAYVIH